MTAALLAAIGDVAAQADPLQPPADAIAWWRLDPSRFTAAQGQQAQRQAALSALRAVVASHLVQDEQGARLLAGALAAAEVGAATHLLALRDFHAVRPPSGTGMDLRSIDMTLVLGAGADHRSTLRTLRAILLSDAPPDAPAGQQRVVALPDGAEGVAFRAANAPSWRELAWTSRKGSFLIALGKDALAHWVASERKTPQSDPPWRAHRAAVDAARPAGDVFFEAWLDLDAFRARFPEAFLSGRTPRTLRALGLDNASQLMLHGRWIDPPPGAAHPPLLALDATWTDAAAPPTGPITPKPYDADEPSPSPSFTIHHRALTLDRWPAALTQPPPQGSFAVVVPVDWPRITALLLDVLEAAQRDSRLARFQAIRARWASLTDQAQQRLFDALAPYVVISDDPAPLLPVPGAASVFVELRPGASADDALAQLALLLSPMRNRVRVDPDTRIWWTRLDTTGLVRAPVWGAATNSRLSLLVAGWSERAVLAARQRLREQLAR